MTKKPLRVGLFGEGDGGGESVIYDTHLASWYYEVSELKDL